MFLIHPIIQFISFLVALYALILGINRFRFLHLHQKAAFKWKQHVLIGTIALVVWITGLFGGLAVVYRSWGSVLMTGSHGQIAMILLPLLIFGLFSGIFLHRFKRKRKILPFIHGINNLLIIFLAGWQIKTGWEIYEIYVLGR